MIRVEAVDDYINYELLRHRNSPKHLESLYKRAMDEGVPIIKPEMEGFLKTLLSILKPRTILELGSAVGYSASVFLSLLPETSIVTVEKNLDLAKRAKKNLNDFGFEGRYKIFNEDILVCEDIRKQTYDFIFVDAAKGSYNEYFDIVKDLINDGGVLVFDNVLHGGDIAKSKYAVNRRQRTIHSRMKVFVNRLLADEDFESTLMSISDGVLFCKKK